MGEWELLRSDDGWSDDGCSGAEDTFAAAVGFAARGAAGCRRARPFLHGNFPILPAVVWDVMLEIAIGIGAAGVVAGFTWEFFAHRPHTPPPGGDSTR